jgi:hypothetical protein
MVSFIDVRVNKKK